MNDNLAKLGTSTISRRAFEVLREEESFTFLKPGSSFHKGFFIVIHEDAYGTVKQWLHDAEEIRRYITPREYETLVNYFSELYSPTIM